MEKILSFFRLHITDKERAHHFIRKAAHMTEYTVLGASVCILFFYLADMRRCKNVSRIGLAGGAWVFTVLFAVTDEIHQAFVPGRGPSVTDVLIDAVGVAVGIGAVLLGYYGIYLRKHSKKKILPEEKENLR